MEGKRLGGAGALCVVRSPLSVARCYGNEQRPHFSEQWLHRPSLSQENFYRTISLYAAFPKHPMNPPLIGTILLPCGLTTENQSVL